MSVDDEERRHSATRLAASPLLRRAQSSKETSGSRFIPKRHPEKNTSGKEVGHEMLGKHELAWSWGLELR